MNKFLFIAALLMISTCAVAQETQDTVDIFYCAEIRDLPPGTIVRWKIAVAQIICRDGKDAFMQDMIFGIKVLDADDWMQTHASIDGTGIGVVENADGTPAYRSLHDANTSWHCNGSYDSYFSNGSWSNFYSWLRGKVYDSYTYNWIYNAVCLTGCFIDSIRTENGEIQAYLMSHPKSEWNPDEQGNISSWQAYQDYISQYSHKIIRVVDHLGFCKTPIDPERWPDNLMGLLLPDGDNFIVYPLDDIGKLQYPTHVQNIENIACEGNRYDLQGRHLSTPPSHGLYIHDGKKVWVK